MWTTLLFGKAVTQIGPAQIERKAVPNKGAIARDGEAYFLKRALACVISFCMCMYIADRAFVHKGLHQTNGFGLGMLEDFLH